MDAALKQSGLSLAVGVDAPAPSQVHRVPTSHGVQHVLVVGRPEHPAVVTYHEAGLTPEQTFGGFFGAPRTGELTEHFCWYHVYAPGTEEGAPEWAGEYPTMDVLASQLGETLQHFGLASAVLLGVGAGGNVALRLASSQPDRVRALILIGTTATTASMYELTDSWVARLESLVWTSVETQHACMRLLARFFAPRTAAAYPDLLARCRTFLNRMTPNMLRFERAYEQRDDITARLAHVKASVLFLAGAASPHADAQDATYEALNPPLPAPVGLRSSGAAGKYVVRVEDAADLLPDEAPSTLLQPLALFFVSLGLRVKELLQLDFVRDLSAVPERQASLRELLRHSAGESVVHVAP